MLHFCVVSQLIGNTYFPAEFHYCVYMMARKYY